MKPTCEFRWAVLQVQSQEAPRVLQQRWVYEPGEEALDPRPDEWREVPLWYTREWPPR